jgi:hypothetical protein
VRRHAAGRRAARHRVERELDASPADLGHADEGLDRARDRPRDGGGVDPSEGGPHGLLEAPIRCGRVFWKPSSGCWIQANRAH